MYEIFGKMVGGNEFVVIKKFSTEDAARDYGRRSESMWTYVLQWDVRPVEAIA